MPPDEQPQGARTHTVSSIDEIRTFFRSRGKHVMSFAGFGELGYEDEQVVERVVRDVVPPERAADLIVNCGTLLRAGGEDGIARVFRVARMLGIETTGIHPAVALDFTATHRVSPDAGTVFFVADLTWGGFLDDGSGPSPTLSTILDVSDELVVIGGGKHAADELTAFWQRGKPVRYFPAEMNRRATREWCARAGVRITDPGGAARDAWLAVTQRPPPVARA